MNNMVQTMDSGVRIPGSIPDLSLHQPDGRWVVSTLKWGQLHLVPHGVVRIQKDSSHEGCSREHIHTYQVLIKYY